MTTAFMDRWATVKANFDVTFGEAFTVLPRVKPGVNARAIVDPSRPETNFIGVYRDPHAQAYPHSPGHADSAAQRFGDGKPTVDFDRNALPFHIGEDDILVRKATGERGEVSDIADDGFVRVKVALTAMRKPT